MCMIGGNLKDLKLLMDYYGRDAKVVDILDHCVTANFSIFEAQNPGWDLDLF